jgi:hypothetical protein
VLGGLDSANFTTPESLAAMAGLLGEALQQHPSLQWDELPSLTVSGLRGILAPGHAANNSSAPPPALAELGHKLAALLGGQVSQGRSGARQKQLAHLPARLLEALWALPGHLTLFQARVPTSTVCLSRDEWLS